MADEDDLFGGWGADDALDGEALVRALSELREGIIALQADMATRLQSLETGTSRAVGSVRSAIEADYVGEMTRLCELVRSVDERLLGLEHRLGQDGEVIQTLRSGVADVEGAARASYQAMGEARTLAGHLDGMMKRRRDYFNQNLGLKRRLVTGILIGVFSMLLLLVMMPGGMETGFARWIMGGSAASAGWRMFDAQSEDWADHMGRMNWVERRNGHQEYLKRCHLHALDTGDFVRCEVLFRPRNSSSRTPPPPPQ